MIEAKYFHGLPAASWILWAGAGRFTTAYVPVHVYESEKCRYIDYTARESGPKEKGLKPMKRK